MCVGGIRVLPRKKYSTQRLKAGELDISVRFEWYIRGGENDYEVKIGDFGLSTILNPSIPEITRCGSPGYVAPEILNKEAYNTKADIFSVGVILYVM